MSDLYSCSLLFTVPFPPHKTVNKQFRENFKQKIIEIIANYIRERRNGHEERKNEW